MADAKKWKFEYSAGFQNYYTLDLGNNFRLMLAYAKSGYVAVWLYEVLDLTHKERATIIYHDRTEKKSQYRSSLLAAKKWAIERVCNYLQRRSDLFLAARAQMLSADNSDPRG